MFPWGALIGLAGQAVSGVASAINNKRTQQAADAEAARQSAYYNAKASENPLSRSENQHLLGQYDRDAQKQVEQARNVAAIKGMTPEYSLGVQKAVAEGRADLMGNMSANASGRADYYKQKGEEAAHQKFLDDQGRKAARNMTYANLAANAASAAGAIMDSYTAGTQQQGNEPTPTSTQEVENKPAKTPLEVTTDPNEQKSTRYLAASKMQGGKATPEGHALALVGEAAQNAEKANTGAAAPTPQVPKENRAPTAPYAVGEDEFVDPFTGKTYKKQSFMK